MNFCTPFKVDTLLVPNPIPAQVGKQRDQSNNAHIPNLWQVKGKTTANAFAMQND